MSPPVRTELRVGLDIVAIDEVADSVECFGDRYLLRIFTSHELSCCRRNAGPGGADTWSSESLAGRFAAKEAVMKVLRPVEMQLDWRSIEVHRMTGGWCQIRLSGKAEELAVDAGIDELSVSMSHEATVAAAVVVGWSSHRDRGVA